MTRNGQSIPFGAFDLDYETNDSFLAYFTIMQSLGLWGKGSEQQHTPDK